MLNYSNIDITKFNKILYIDDGYFDSILFNYIKTNEKINIYTNNNFIYKTFSKQATFISSLEEIYNNSYDFIYLNYSFISKFPIDYSKLSNKVNINGVFYIDNIFDSNDGITIYKDTLIEINKSFFEPIFTKNIVDNALFYKKTDFSKLNINFNLDLPNYENITLNQINNQDDMNKKLQMYVHMIHTSKYDLNVIKNFCSFVTSLGSNKSSECNELYFHIAIQFIETHLINYHQNIPKLFIVYGDLLRKINDPKCVEIYNLAIHNAKKNIENPTNNGNFKLIELNKYIMRYAYEIGLSNYYLKNLQTKKRTETIQRALKDGLWTYYNQRPGDEFISSVKSSPFLDKNLISFTNFLEENYKIIKEEYLEFEKKKTDVTDYEDNYLIEELKTWTVVQLGTNFKKQRQFFPKTCKLLNQIDTLYGLNLQKHNASIKLSVLDPNTHITPHCGNLNTRVRIHLGLIIPDGCYIRCDKTLNTWEEGKVFVLDDSFEHEVWNWSNHKRVILIIDVWHPNINKEVKKKIIQDRQNLPVNL